MKNPFMIRVAILAAGLSILLFFLFDRRILIPAGIFTGTILSLHKIKNYRKRIEEIAGQGKKTVAGAIGSGILYLLLPFAVLLAAIMVDQWLFMGVAVGLLIFVPVILVNIITEKTGLSHNEWAEWF